MKHSIAQIMGFLLLLAGVAVFLYPTVSAEWLKRETRLYVETYEKQREIQETMTEEEVKEIKEADALYVSAKDYNEALYESAQQEFKDPWSCTQVPAALSGWTDREVGYIEIPAMDVKLMLYMGATKENMASGAAILGQTSLPVGGTNTNCVIAGHRGYRGAPYFREIEKLQKGDEVIIHNPWETLTYMVESMAVISPYDSDMVKIQDGKDMITLLTCHPYRSHGKYRYVVYCVRADGDTEGREEATEEGGEGVVNIGDIALVSSEPDIEKEHLVRMMGAAVLICMSIGVTIQKLRYNWRKERDG